MKNQRGVTLVELLVIISIMGVTFIPITMMLINSLNTEREVSIKNETQREARLIMEYMTEKMKNKDVYWYDDGTNYVLGKYDFANDSWYERYLTYNKTNIMYLGSNSGNILSDNIVKFTLDPGPIELFSEIDFNADIQNITLKIAKSREEFELKSSVYFNRFY